MRASPRWPAPIASACSCRSPKRRATPPTTTIRPRSLRSQRRLEFGQVLLASIGSTAPFVGLLGTVWGIYHALGSIAASGQAQIENVAGPVGEALIMTAFGLVVAIPAVLAYNILGRLVRQLAEELDGFARDLHVFVCAQPA